MPKNKNFSLKEKNSPSKADLRKDQTAYLAGISRSGTVEENSQNRNLKGNPKEFTVTKSLALNGGACTCEIDGEALEKACYYKPDENAVRSINVKIVNDGSEPLVVQDITFGKKSFFDGSHMSKLHIREDDNGVHGHHTIKRNESESFSMDITYTDEEKAALSAQRKDPYATSCTVTPIGEELGKNRIVYLPLARFCDKKEKEGAETFVKLAIDAHRENVESKVLRYGKSHVYGIARETWEPVYKNIVIFEEIENRSICICFASGRGPVLIEAVLKFDGYPSYRKAIISPENVEDAKNEASALKDVWPWIPPVFSNDGELEHAAFVSLGNSLQDHLVLTKMKDDPAKLLEHLNELMSESISSPVVTFLSKAIEYYGRKVNEFNPNQDRPLIQSEMDDSHLAKKFRSKDDKSSICKQMETIEMVLFKMLQTKECTEDDKLFGLSEYSTTGKKSPLAWLEEFVNKCPARHGSVHELQLKRLNKKYNAQA
jgi:hypothetical protein